MKKRDFTVLLRHLNSILILIIAFVAALTGPSGPALGQAYTYDTPTCGASYREERSKPQQLRVVWEMRAAQECVQQSKFPVACRHLQAALTAADHMEAEAGSPDDIKIYLKTMMKTHGCQ